jgi:Flp pilus assembly protein TadG
MKLSQIARVIREENGQTVVLMGVIMGLLMTAFVALAIDVGVLYHAKRQVQTAADAAAITAAAQYSKNDVTGTALQADALAAAEMQSGINSATVIVPSPVVSTTNKDVIVTVNQPTTTFFLGSFIPSLRTINVTATAEARLTVPVSSGNSCDYGNSVVVSGGGTLASSPDCGISAGGTPATGSPAGTITVSGSGEIDACSVNATSTIGTSGGSGSIILQSTSGMNCATSTSPNMASIPDPLVNTVPNPMAAGTGFSASDCTAVAPPNNGGSSYTLGPGITSAASAGTTTYAPTMNLTVSGQPVSAVCYPSITIGNNDTTTLNPGLYIINGGTLTLGGGDNITASGVTFYLTAGATLEFANNVNGTLSAPTTGPYANMLFYGDSTVTSQALFAGGASGGFVGSIYFPAAPLTFNNDVDININGFVDSGGVLTLAGSGRVNNTYDPYAAGNAPYTPNEVYLVK